MNGLWTAEFGSSTGRFGGGVTVFQDGKILGGDGTYYYVGHYKLQENTFEATLKISPFIEGAESIFKTVGQNLILELAGSFTEHGQAIAQGYPQGMPNVKFGVKLTRRG
jgi:hypothetical protein